MGKSFSQFLILLFTLSILTLPSKAQDFEGVIYYEVSVMESEGLNQMSYQIKGDKTRLDFGDGERKGSMIYMPETSKMVFLIHTQKGYLESDMKANESDMADYSDVEVSKTGETKTIAGKKCEVWKTISKDNTIETCVAKGLGTFMMPKNPMAKDNTPDWAKELMGDGAMPLEVIEIENGNRNVQMRAKKIEEKSLSADRFEVPEGYKDMGAMLRQMQQMRQNGQ